MNERYAELRVLKVKQFDQERVMDYRFSIKTYVPRNQESGCIDVMWENCGFLWQLTVGNVAR